MSVWDSIGAAPGFGQRWGGRSGASGHGRPNGERAFAQAQQLGSSTRHSVINASLRELGGTSSAGPVAMGAQHTARDWECQVPRGCWLSMLHDTS
ncbi:hypothetical protein MTER_22320 [Mycolicibacter terrae]|uniref:Uncharacterized protein n=1 Tax=Mycolicibacter terrae TaxID=1788 RepID=A0AAD1HY77_9MYCO|nr:hypothetical protein MTER_22320 [Mycolicibacter terrae]